MKHIIPVLIALTTATATAAQIYEADDDTMAECERILTSNLKSWKLQARENLAKIATYPVYPVTVSTGADGLVAKAFGIKPIEVNLLAEAQLKASVEGDRLILEIKDWGSFQRAQISLRSPEVVKDFSLAELVMDDDGYAELSVQANTRLFYPMRDLPHETQLGLLMPLREFVAAGRQTPFFEFQIVLLRSCLDDGSGELRDQMFKGEDGESLCIDPLVTLSTWPEPLPDSLPLDPR